MVRRTGSLLLWGAPSTDAAINPASLGGGASLKLWLDAEDITGLNDGDPVTTWNDSSGNGNNVTQATAAKKPTYRTNVVNGKPIVRFDGVDDLLVRTAADAVSTALQGTAGWVIKMNSAATTGQVIGSSDEATDSSFWHTFVNATTQVNRMISNQAGVSDEVVGTTSMGTAAFRRVIWDSDGSTWRLFFNGVEESLSVTLGVNSGDWLGDVIGRDNFTVGADKALSGEFDFLNGDIAEIVLYDVQLSDGDRAALNAYFSNKYGV